MMMAVGCGKDTPDPEPGPDPDPDVPVSVTEINGTTISEGNNLVGLISDSKTGKGIPGVPVTDGYTFTVTDGNGVYQMEANRYCRKVYYSLPSGYQTNLDGTNHLPEFFSTKAIDRTKVNRNDFVLTPTAQDETNFTLVMIGDPQCRTESDVQRYVKETIPDIQSQLNSDKARFAHPYAITLGDITFDYTTRWDPMRASMSNVKLEDGSYLPFYQCIGNHDHDAAEANDYKATDNFFNYFGPTDYSFNIGKAHIIVMDDVAVTSTKSSSSSNSGKTWQYNGGLTAAQYKWLVEDLSYVQNKEDKVVFFCAHIPFRGGAANGGGASVSTDMHYAEVLKLLTDFNEAHIMIGHTHYNQNWIHAKYKCKGGQPIYEHVHGAACGAWWNSNSTVIGGPNGYSVYEVKGNSVHNWISKGVNHPESYQLRVYDGDQTYTGSKGYKYNWYNTSNKGGSSSIVTRGNASFKNSFVVEIFDDDDRNWQVEFYQNGAKVGNFTRVANGQSANVCVASYYFNELGKNSTTWSSRTASHYWYFKPASGNPSSESDWEVRATRTIPSSGYTTTFIRADLTTDYSEF